MSKTTIRILSFDPGLSKAGWAVGDFKLQQGHLIINRFGELAPTRTTTHVHMKEQVSYFGKRIITLSLLREMIDILFLEYKPDYVVVESAFFHPKFPTAYAALLQWMTTVELYLYHTHNMPMYKIAPKAVKFCISGHGGSGKVSVQEAILAKEDISFKQKKQVIKLGQHEGDAIAVNYTFATESLPSLLAARNLTDVKI